MSKSTTMWSSCRGSLCVATHRTSVQASGFRTLGCIGRLRRDRFSAALRYSRPKINSCCCLVSQAVRLGQASISCLRSYGVVLKPDNRKLFFVGRRQFKSLCTSTPELQSVSSSQDFSASPPMHGNGIGNFTLSPGQLKDLLASGKSIYSSGIVSSAKDLATSIGSSLKTGLAVNQLDFDARKRYYGENRLAEKPALGFWAYVQEALEDFTVGVLIVAGIVSIALDLVFDAGGDDGWIEGAAILAAVFVVVMVTAVNNYQKERQFKELNALQNDVTVRVIRDSHEIDIMSYDVLVGDVLVVETGDIVCADGVLFVGHNIRVDESNLTGEPDDVEKSPHRAPIILSGSKVLEGVGRLLVLAVGPNSQQGLILSLVKGGRDDNQDDTNGLREETVLQQKLSELASLIGQFGLAAGLLAAAALSVEFTWDTFYVQHLPWSWTYMKEYLHFLILGITILVVAIPEGLPLAITIGLAFSVKRMLADKNLVRHLGAAETMGCATTICCDKTGTLTQNDMAVVRLHIAGMEIPGIKQLLQESAEKLMPVALAARRAGAAAQNGVAVSESANGAAMLLASSEERLLYLSGRLGLPATALELLRDAVAVNSTAGVTFQTETGSWLKHGSRTECALLEAVVCFGADFAAIRDSYTVLELYPFSSERKRMSTLAYLPQHCVDGMVCARLFTKGAAEIVLSLCDNKLGPDGTVENMTEEDKQQLLASFGRDGRRMLCLAYRDLFLPATDVASMHLSAATCEQHLVFMAMVGLEDPLRPEVTLAVEQMQRAGIVVRMLTGDNGITAFSIARQCGIVPRNAPLPLHVTADGKGLKAWKKKVLELLATQDGFTSGSDMSWSSESSNDWSTKAEGNRVLASAPDIDSEFLVMESSEFRKYILNSDGSINVDAFNRIWPKMRVLARCTPLDKYTIVKACKSNPREIVAMTGDGTNDAPALRLANVGFAMASGTSIAKEASDILLLDDNFNSIVQAVKWGRNVYVGATKFLQFQLTINVGAVVTATLGAFVLRASPLAAIQMLWVNLIMDSLASLALATEPPSEDVLDQPPYSVEGSIVTPTVLKNIVGQTLYQLGVVYWLVCLSPAALGWFPDAGAAGDSLPTVHYTMVFNTFVCMQLFNQVNARKLRDDQNVLSGITRDRLFVSVLAAEAALQVLLVQGGGAWFHTLPLDGREWVLCLAFGAGSLLVREVLRYVPAAEEATEKPQEVV